MRSVEDRNKVPETLDLSQETPCSSYKPSSLLSGTELLNQPVSKEISIVVIYLMAYSYRKEEKKEEELSVWP